MACQVIIAPSAHSRGPRLTPLNVRKLNLIWFSGLAKVRARDVQTERGDRDVGSSLAAGVTSEHDNTSVTVLGLYV